MNVRIRPALLMLAVAACASSKAYAPPDPGPVDPPPPAEPQVMPPHRFDPRPHEARTHPEPVAAPLTSLPAMKRKGRCVPAGAVPEGKPRSPRLAKAKKKAPRRGASTSGASRRPAADAKPSRPAAEPAPASGAAARDFTEVENQAPASPPPMAAEDRAEREESRKDRRARRRAKRRGGDAPPVAPSADAEHAPLNDAGAALQVAERPPQPIEPIWPPPGEGWGEAVYVSNDDTMSLSSAQRVTYAIDNFEPLPPQHVRPHELLNYFSFDTAPVERGHDFSVQAELAPSSAENGLYSLALSVAGRPVGRQGRRNAVLTLVVDRSGSMRSEGRMEYLKRGLLRMVRELKPGDVVHLVTFDHRVCVPLQNYVVGRDDPRVLTRAIHGIRPSGQTNLHAGLTRGYELADRSYQPRYTNRVLLVTDALANKGVTDARTLAMVSDWYDSRRIRLSGIGVGSKFDDVLLDRLTEKGRGAYVFLGSPAEVDAVFGSRFVSLIETTANDVHFRLHLPPSLRMQVFHGEEASTFKEEVQAVHFFADTSVLLLSELEAWQGELRPQDDIMLEIEYLHPETGDPMVEEYAFSLGEIGEQTRNLRKAELITHFIQGIGRMAVRGAPAKWKPRPGTWQDAEALADCARTRGELEQMEVDRGDPEVRRVLSLWDGFCARFEGPGGPRPPRKDVRQRDRWPGGAGR